MPYSFEVRKDNFLKKVKKVHNDKYDYSLSEYQHNNVPIKIICPKHGVFEQTPNAHSVGSGCKKCYEDRKKDTTEKFIEKATVVHGDRYDYSLVDYKSSYEDVMLICKKHGEFKQRPNNHLNGANCFKCGKEEMGEKQRIEKEQFFSKVREVHNNFYSYDEDTFTYTKNKIKIICPKHGVFEQKAHLHKKGHGCLKCAGDKIGIKQTRDGDSVLIEANKVHNSKYDYSLFEYKTSKDKSLVICKKHGVFEQNVTNHLQGAGCPKCVNRISKNEQEIIDFIKIFTNVNISTRNVMQNNKEVDISVPHLDLAFEYNGLYWHSEKYKDAQYHIEKTISCANKGVQLIHIFEDEWVYKKDIVKSRILNLINKTPNKIYARKCEIKEVNSKDSLKFLDENHIQGKIGAKIRIGLYYDNELVSLMTFGELRKSLGNSKKEGSFELLRFCNKLNTNVIGGASKLLNYFEKSFDYKEIISYADRRWSKGDLYLKIGFDLISETKPNYFYIKSNKRENRFSYRKSILVKEGYDKKKTEKEIMKERGYNRIYDCGSLKFIKTNNR